MDTRKKTQLQAQNVKMNLNPARRTSTDQQTTQVLPENLSFYLEDIRKITSQLSQQMDNLSKEMKLFKTEIKKELRDDLKEINSTVEKISSDLKNMKDKIDNLEDKQLDAQEEIEEIKVRQNYYEEEQLIRDAKLREKCIKIRVFRKKREKIYIIE